MSNILMGVTGGISAYKAADIIGAIRKHSHDVRVIMTEKSKQFITPLTLASLSKHEIYDDQIEWSPTGRIDHVELARWADLLVIAPLTANTLVKLYRGIADNLLTSVYMALKYEDGEYIKDEDPPLKEVVLCPAMNTHMWEKSHVEKAVKLLSKRSHHTIINPIEGLLACGDYGIGKIAPTVTIVETINELLAKNVTSVRTIFRGNKKKPCKICGKDYWDHTPSRKLCPK